MMSTSVPTLRRRLAAGVGAGLVVGLAACSGQNTSAPAPSPTRPSAEVAKASPSQYIGSGTNVFTVDLSQAPVVPDAPKLAAKIEKQVTSRYNGVAGLNVSNFSATMYVTDPSTPRIRMNFDDCQKKNYVPQGLFDGPQQFVDVPMPADAAPSPGTDKAMSILDPATDKLWEFWVTEKNRKTGAWSACWGGRLDDVSKAAGPFPNPFGATASGLPMVGSMVTLDEARRNDIPHAVSLVLVDTGKDFSYPANRSDGQDSSPDAIPLGSRIRLDPSVNVDALPMAPLGKAIAKAAQKYGFIVVDTSGAVSVIAQNGASVQKQTGKDPWAEILAGTQSYDVMKGFPWDKVQVIQKDYGKPAAG